MAHIVLTCVEMGYVSIFSSVQLNFVSFKFNLLFWCISNFSISQGDYHDNQTVGKHIQIHSQVDCILI
jgi:hypothetical protein